MPSTQYWLLDTQFKEDERIIQQTFLQTPAQTLVHVETDFLPYFYATPTSLGEPVKRKDLMKNQVITVAQVPSTSTAKTQREWERKLTPNLSYVYDQSQRFGCPHKRTSAGYELDLQVPAKQLKAFNSRFAQIVDQDPLKFEFLKEFFRYTTQPIPQIPRDQLELDSKFDDARILWGELADRLGYNPGQPTASRGPIAAHFKGK